ncbi:VOC family protein [Solihabitans fulvus]|uniref:VOC family protein n=1 Tax=Solihabitans fulvus TaxID=1892852 RepID=A0A5B2WQF1_9PSEU|nr:VOC family protein [Solihabitans fulvus]KAA2253000.1 VOC family protein [Solihabitans fulvus]
MNSTRAADIDYIDHAVLLTKDLDALSERYQALGFTLSPPSPHQLSDRPGGPLTATCTANRCALFGESYLELLGIVDETAPDPWRVRPVAEERQGFRGLVFGCGDAEVVSARLAASGLSSSGVLSLAREVDTPEGTRTMRASSVHVDHRSGGWLGAASHLDPEYVHQARYLRHANGATRLDGVLVAVDDGELDDEVTRYSLILDAHPEVHGPRHVFELRTGRVEIVPASAFGDVLPGETSPALPSFAALSVAVADLTAARNLVEGNGIATRSVPAGFLVASADACGVSVRFVAND